CCARNITGTVVMRRSSMIRGLVRATNAITRAPNGRRAGLWLAPSTPGGRDSTAVTHTPTETSQQASACEATVKARAYHATVDVAQTRTFAGVGSCWKTASRGVSRGVPEVRIEARLSTRMSGSVFICRMPVLPGREADPEEARQSGMARKIARPTGVGSTTPVGNHRHPTCGEE